MRQERGPVLDQTGGNLALDLFVVDQHLGQLMDVSLRETGLTGALYAVYSQLASRSMTPGELTSVLGIRPTTLSGYVATMERKGHLTRTRHHHDGRSRLLVLTDEGVAVWRLARPRVRKAVRALHDSLGASSVPAFREQLGEVDRAIRHAIDALTLER